ncbi:MAG: flagellar export chaperone FliS [Ignavibacteriaceae bacterium]
MYTQTLTKNNPNRMNQYLVKEVLEATPEQLLIKVYDFAILNCQRNNLEKTNKAIKELINFLRWDTEEGKAVNAGLFRLYEYCQEEMRKKNTEIVFKILTELRETWLKAFKMK